MEFLFKNIEPDVKEQLLNAPALLSIYSANHNGKLTKDEIHAVLDYNKIESYSSPNFLHDFFNEVAPNLREKIEQFETILPNDKNLRREAIEKKLQPVREYLENLKENEANEIKKALLGFVEHIYYTHESIFEEVLFPVFSSHLNGKNIKNLEKGLL